MAKSEAQQERLQALFDRALDKLELLLEEDTKAFMVRPEVDGPCEKCGCSHIRYGKGPDIKAILEALDKLHNQGFGRPAQELIENEAGFSFVNEIVLGGERFVKASDGG